MGLAERIKLTAAVHKLAFDRFEGKITQHEMEAKLREIFPSSRAEKIYRTESAKAYRGDPVDRKKAAANDGAEG
jgi:hypothetical protein